MMPEKLKRRGRRSLVSLACGALCLLLAATLAACEGGEVATKDSNAKSNAALKRGVKPEPDAQVAVVETEFGQIVIELYPNLAPQMVERFKRLVGEGFYDGTAFHRVNPALGVVQGGSPNSRDDDPANDGIGQSPYPNLPAEFSDIPYERGIVGAARSNSPDSANSQFYITLKRVPQWDGEYTVFGRVIKGMGDADIIARAPVITGTESPDPKIIIRRITLQPRANFV